MSAAVQHTLAGPATLEGTSLHTGQKVTLTLKPAPEGHGFKFRRIDLPDQPFINADVDKVQTVERATTLAEGSVRFTPWSSSFPRSQGWAWTMP